MPLYLPRRHRRPLLFPPGLLALAGLLWLGCTYIKSDLRIKRHAVLQLSVFKSRKPIYRRGISYLEEEDIKEWMSAQKLANIRRWKSFQLTGSAKADTTTMKQVVQYLPLLQTSLDSIHGIQIQFFDHSKYSSLVYLLSELNRKHIHRYVFEVRTNFPILYILYDYDSEYQRTNSFKAI